ncbi:hypothetical protein [Renibacterium salmoninarum]|uniref:hypothetical protein n=1 Tax=Renibacterium salmoninarum TaxID=1646 RepID=UPI0002DE6154|nr:hypothetical protein [Renibacterium salmoninarum]
MGVSLSALLALRTVTATGNYLSQLSMSVGWLFLGLAAQLFLLIGDSANEYLRRRGGWLPAKQCNWKLVPWWILLALVISLSIFSQLRYLRQKQYGIFQW